MVVVTGQHREMLDQVNTFFGITPDVDLDLMIHGATPNAIARAVLREMESAARAASGRTPWSSRATPRAPSPPHSPPSWPMYRWCTSRRACAPATCARRSPKKPTAGSPGWWPPCTWRPRPPARRNLEREGVDPATDPGHRQHRRRRPAVGRQAAGRLHRRTRGRARAGPRARARDHPPTRVLGTPDAGGDERAWRRGPRLTRSSTSCCPLHRNQVVRDAVTAGPRTARRT